LKQVQENEKELTEKKKMTKADIAALKEPKGKIDANDLAALRAGEHKKKVDEETIEEAKHNNTPAGVECPVCGMKACPTVKEEAEQIDEAAAALSPEHKTAITAHVKKMWGKGKVTFDHSDGMHTVSHSDGVQTHVHSIRMKGGKAHVTHFMDMDEETVEEGVRSLAKSSRTLALKKKSLHASRRVSKASYKPPGTPSKEDMRKAGEDAVRKFTALGRKITREEVEDEIETLDEAQFIVIQKGMEKKRIRNNPAEIMQARKDGWAINEEAEQVDEVVGLALGTAAGIGLSALGMKTGVIPKAVDKASAAIKKLTTKKPVKEDAEQVEEGSEMQNLAKSQASAVVKREVQQKKAMFAKKDSVDKQKFSKAMQNIKAGDEVEMDSKTVFMERAIAILGEEFADASYEALVEEIVKRGRGRPRKDGSTGPKPAPTGPKRGRGRPRKDAGSASAASSSTADTDKDREHIVMGLRKAVSLRGEHHVKFADGSSHKIPAEHAQRALKMHDSLSKPSEKMTFARKLAASHDSFKKALQDKNPGAEETKKTGITLAKRAD
jgi:hypothetical protein